MENNNYLNDGFLNLLLLAAMLMLVIPAFLPLIGINEEWMVYVYILGAICAVVTRILQRVKYRKDKTISTRIRRLLHIEFWSSMCYMVSAYFMVADPYHHGNWIAFLLAGAVLQIYTSQMIMWRQKKEREGKAKTQGK